MNRWRVLSIGLAISLMMAQVSYANVYITPFGTAAQVQESVAAETSQATEATEGIPVGENYGPGFVDTSKTQKNEGNNQSAAVQNTQQNTQVQGPGAAEQQVSSIVKPSASYSTKEPVQVMPKTEPQAAGPGAGLTNGPGGMLPPAANVQTHGPGAATTGNSAENNTENTVQTQTQADVPAVEIAEPIIAAESAILYDVTHDRVLYEKNADTKRYPASITKILTALLVLENASLDEMVTYSENAVTRLESGAVTLSLQAGDKVSVKDSLYGLMLKSANEVANGLAEHVGGTIYGFADMMNAKAKALGCTNTNFVNPNGLNDSDHYTTARDMAKIAKAAFENEMLCKITSTTTYKFPATKAVGARTLTMGHKMLHKTDSRYYDGIVGGKTGYTSLAGNTLVTCVERDGVRMIAVILKSRSSHYPDTKALLDYGYELEKASACGSVGTVMYGTENGANVQNTTTTANTANTMNVETQSGTAFHKWIADGDVWRFELADGTRLSNCFVTIDGVEYAFDTEGKMVTGWLTLGQNWHFFGNSGGMIENAWRKDGDYWFYLGVDGAMLRNTWIDNQYYVGADGVWIE